MDHLEQLEQLESQPLEYFHSYENCWCDPRLSASSLPTECSFAESPSPDRTTSSPEHTTPLSLDITEYQPHSKGQKADTFKQFPIELIQSIASTLSLPAAVSFTLTCRRVSIILGSQYLNQLREKGGPERLEFVELLERDLPRHILCYKCGVFHSRKQRQPFLPTFCKIADIKSYHRLYLGPEFDSITFLLAMKFNRHGFDPSEHLSNLTGSGTILRPTHIRHWESTPRIVNGHFLLRRQT
jgi:hypothetical protein